MSLYGSLVMFFLLPDQLLWKGLKSPTRGVSNFPTYLVFWGYLQNSDTGTRQFSDSFSLSSQIYDKVHRVW